MTSAPLYEIAGQREVLDTWLEEADGELTPTLEALLAEFDEAVDLKIERCALWIQEQKGIAEAIKVEEDRLRARRHAREKAAESLRSYLKVQLERLGKTSVKGRLATVALQLSPPAVTSTLTDDQLHRLYWATPDDGVITRVPESYRIDRNAILNAVKAGEPIPEGISVTRDMHVRIR